MKKSQNFLKITPATKLQLAYEIDLEKIKILKELKQIFYVNKVNQIKKLQNKWQID